MLFPPNSVVNNNVTVSVVLTENETTDRLASASSYNGAYTLELWHQANGIVTRIDAHENTPNTQLDKDKVAMDFAFFAIA